MVSGKRGKRPQPTALQKKHRKDKADALQKDITAAQDVLLGWAKKIATKHSRSLPWVTGRLLMGGKLLRTKRRSNAWTVFLAQKLHSINSKRKPGDRLKVSSIPSDVMEDIKAEYKGMGDEDLEELREEGAKARKTKETAGRQTEAGRQKDFDATFGNLVQEAVAVQERTRCEIVILAVRGDTMHTARPIVYASPRARAWISFKFKLSLSEMGLQFEAFVVGNVATGEFTIIGNKINDHVGWVRERIAEGLNCFLLEARLIAPGEKVKMEYKNYPEKIVKKFGIELHGWPLEDRVNDIAKLTRKNLNTVIEALKDGSCRWEKLMDDELCVRLQQLASPSRAPLTLEPTPSASITPIAATTPPFAFEIAPPTPAEAAALEALARMGGDFQFNVDAVGSSFLGDQAAPEGALTLPNDDLYGTASNGDFTPYGSTPSLLGDQPISWAPAVTLDASSSSSSASTSTLTWV
ncbi:hypothetical protein FA95DRAFT_1609681 [Auriscalpium vulgare]|uniref:Uncharacterized protein n=1 Tax=Auriscalpium vulgare TaxID=40419 RepID=A0ACB8RG48_9AGAM|nr:hypothetical protein FA95DRAFT_1609681 [Auriscalpium vulgare]